MKATRRSAHRAGRNCTLRPFALASLFLLLSACSRAVGDGSGPTGGETDPTDGLPHPDDVPAIEVLVTPGGGADSIHALLKGELARDGGTMWFAPGVYELDRPLVPPAGVVLRGRAAGDSLATLRLTAPGFQAAIKVLGVDDVCIEGLALDGALTASNRSNRYGIHVAGPARGLTIRHCRFTGFSHAIRVDKGKGAVENAHIVENEIRTQTADEDFVNFGIFVHSAAGARNVRIERNDISGRNPGGGGGSAIYFGGSRSSIVENFIHDYRTRDLGGIGILLLAGAEDVLVARNSFRTVWGDNVSVRGARAMVVGNAIVDSKDQGIVVEDTSDATVIRNATTETETPGLRVLNSAHVLIARNDVHAAATDPAINAITRAGICIANSDDPSEAIEDVVIERNRIHTHSAALYGIALGDNDLIRDIRLGPNVVRNAPTPLGGGAYPRAVRLDDGRRGAP